MADEEQPLSKRERQKQRKQAKREAQQAARRQQRRRKLVATGLVAALVVAALGAAGFVWQQSRAERGELLAGNAQAAEAAGCASVEEFEAPAENTHFAATELEANPPNEVYDHRPHTGDRHTGNVLRTGVWDRPIDERITGHNLEHGYVVAFWSADADDADVDALQQATREAIDGGDEKLIAAEWMGDAPMDDDARIALVAWEHRLLCDSFDEEVFTAFVEEHHDSFDVPEPGGSPHLDVGVDPDSYEEERLLLPPLGDNQQLVQEATGG